MPISQLPILVPALLLVACRFDSPPNPPAPVLEGHFQYVVNAVAVPTSSLQAAELGLDLDGDEVVDNELGAAFAALAAYGIDVQAPMTVAIDRGGRLLLLDLQTGSSSNGDPTALQIWFGDPASAMPAPCAYPTDVVCRRHLNGTGLFRVAADSPEDLVLVGKDSEGTFESDPGNFSLELPLGGSERLQLDLFGARVKMSGLAENGIDHITLAGGLPDEDAGALILWVLEPTLQEDCWGITPPNCGCTTGSTGQALLRLLDKSPQDCAIKVEEIIQNPVIYQDPPDLIIDGRPVRSFGMKVSAVRALFLLPAAGAAQ